MSKLVTLEIELIFEEIQIRSKFIFYSGYFT